MFAVNHLRTLAGAWQAVACCLLAAFVACASAPSPTPVARERAATRLSDVRVESGSDATQVTLEGVAAASFETYRESDPDRVVVELADVEPTGLAPSMAVYDGVVDEVSVEGVQEGDAAKTRVAISLGTDVEYRAEPVEDGLQVTLRPVAGATTAPEAPEDPWSNPVLTGAATPAPEGEAGKALAASVAQPAAENAEIVAGDGPEAPRATQLVGVSARSEAAGLQVELRANGRIDSARNFLLEDPLRLVLDLPGLTSQVRRPVVAMDGGMVKRLRIGQHPEKVRIVLDAAEGVDSFGSVTLAPEAKGLLVALGASAAAPETAADSGPEEAKLAEAGLPGAEPAAEAAAKRSEPEAVDAVQAEAAEKPTPKALAHVHGVAFHRAADAERVEILTDGAVAYSTLQPDLSTFVVRLPGTTLDLGTEEASRITPEEPHSVSLVSAFEQPGTAEPEVRVLIRQAPGLIPELSQEGSKLVVTFPRGAELAQSPPMLQAPEPAAAPEAQEAPEEPAAPPAQRAEAGSQPQATSETAEPGPAAIDPGESSVDILHEGGLVDGKQYTGRRVSLDFKDVDIDDVLRLIAEVSDLNIIAGDEVQGQVTIRLVDVPWDQALDVILLTKGLGFVRVGNVLRIAPADVLKAEEEARLQERRAHEKLEDLVVKLQPVNYANVKDVQKMVKRLLTPRGSVDVDQRTNTVILKDIASVIDEATALIKAIDTQTPQVMIEAKIVEARLDFLRELGSRWSVGVQPNKDAFDPSSDPRRHVGGSDFKLRNVNTTGLPGLINSNHVAVSNPITELATGVVNLGAFLLDERFNVDVQLEAAESHGDGKVISSPRVVTLDNRKASIEQGVSIPFQTFENGDAKLEFIDAVLSLDVTPHITADRSIIMQIEVQRNAPDDSVATPTGSPAIAKNEAQTETLVKDGQTLVLGGIYVTRESNRESRVPYLHKIPLIGSAFKSNEVRDQREELLVFVTPRIVVQPETGS